MDLHEALGQISEIRAQVGRTETFRGFRSVTVGFSGLLAVMAGVLQQQRLPQATQQVQAYVDLWLTVALISLIVVAAELAFRWSCERSSLKRRLTLLAIQQFAPCLIAGAAVTLAITTGAPQSAWMLPGLWAILFSLGVFACCRLLPPATVWVGIYYLVAGTICLFHGSGPHALSAWFMVGTFGVGQFLAAGILYHTLERSHGQLEA
jgi:hypothetical protein